MKIYVNMTHAEGDDIRFEAFTTEKDADAHLRSMFVSIIQCAKKTDHPFLEALLKLGASAGLTYEELLEKGSLRTLGLVAAKLHPGTTFQQSTGELNEVFNADLYKDTTTDESSV